MTFSCSRCGKTHEVEVHPSINVSGQPALKQSVLDGSLFLWQCPSCGASNLARYQTLYHDPEEKLMVWLLPAGAAVPEGVAEAVKELGGYTLRRVSDVGTLIEKVKIHETGLDDLVLEMCKKVTRLELADKAADASLLEAPLKFYRTEGADNEIVFSFPQSGEMKLVNVGFNVYEDCRGIVLRNPSLLPPAGFADIGPAWIDRFFR